MQVLIRTECDESRRHRDGIDATLRNGCNNRAKRSAIISRVVRRSSGGEIERVVARARIFSSEGKIIRWDRSSRIMMSRSNGNGDGLLMVLLANYFVPIPVPPVLPCSISWFYDDY